MRAGLGSKWISLALGGGEEGDRYSLECDKHILTISAEKADRVKSEGEE